MDDDDQVIVGLGGIAAICVGAAATIALYSGPNTIPSDASVDPGYAIPAKMKIEVKDLRNDKGKETVLEYDGRSYLLKVDQDGQPYAVPYKVETKILPVITPEKMPGK
jgi:hypothetical protein